MQFSEGTKGDFHVNDLRFELQIERHTRSQVRDTTCVYADVYLWNTSLGTPPRVDFTLSEQSADEHARLVHQLMTTGLVLVDNLLKQEGVCMNSAAACPR